MKVGDKFESLTTLSQVRKEGSVYEIIDIDSIFGETFISYVDDQGEVTSIVDFEEIKFSSNEAEKKVEVTAKDIDRAYKKASQDALSWGELIYNVKKELGLV